ncbi:MAG: hypothetical protein R2862_12595 [Thermoanaerobaculia bacterium]
MEFASHYHPSVLEALSDRRISPQIAVSNRIDLPSYSELREVGRKVIQVLEIGTSATHMEWSFVRRGSRSSRSAPGRPRADLGPYCVGNDLRSLPASGPRRWSSVR